MAQMFDHTLDVIQGPKSGADLHCLDYKAPLSADVTIDPLPAGRVVHINADGEFEAGAQGHQMPMFLLSGSADHDVANPDGNSGHDWTAVAPTGNMVALVATGGFELETTEFMTDGEYAPNDLLKAPTEGQLTTGKSDAGKLANTLDLQDYSALSGAITLGTHSVCGIVSKGAYQNHNKRDVLRFWTYFHAAMTN